MPQATRTSQAENDITDLLIDSQAVVDAVMNMIGFGHRTQQN